MTGPERNGTTQYTGPERQLANPLRPVLNAYASDLELWNVAAYKGWDGVRALATQRQDDLLSTETLRIISDIPNQQGTEVSCSACSVAPTLAGDGGDTHVNTSRQPGPEVIRESGSPSTYEFANRPRPEHDDPATGADATADPIKYSILRDLFDYMTWTPRHKIKCWLRKQYYEYRRFNKRNKVIPSMVRYFYSPYSEPSTFSGHISSVISTTREAYQQYMPVVKEYSQIVASGLIHYGKEAALWLAKTGFKMGEKAWENAPAVASYIGHKSLDALVVSIGLTAWGIDTGIKGGKKLIAFMRSSEQEDKEKRSMLTRDGLILAALFGLASGLGPIETSNRTLKPDIEPVPVVRPINPTIVREAEDMIWRRLVASADSCQQSFFVDANLKREVVTVKGKDGIVYTIILPGRLFPDAAEGEQGPFDPFSGQAKIIATGVQ